MTRVHRFTLSLLILLFLGLSSKADAAGSPEALPLGPIQWKRASKLSFRSSSGILKNQGTMGGENISVGGLNLLFLYYPSTKVALGIGYRMYFDYMEGLSPVRGVFAAGRYYFRGAGTRSSSDSSPDLRIERQDAWALYGGANVAHSSYYIGSNNGVTTMTLTGSYMTVDITGGMDVKLSREFELNAELCRSTISFSTSDDRFRISETVGIFGLSYFW